MTLERLLMGVAGLGLVLVAGCGPRRLPADTAVVQFAQEPDTLNPYLSALASTDAIASLFYSGLVQLDERGRWVEDLATRVPTAENGDVVQVGSGMQVSYHLRPKAVWQDGRPLTASDLVATFKLVMDPRFPGLSRAGYEEIERIDTPNAYTAVLRFRRPYAPYLELFPFVLPAHLIAASPHPEREAWNRAPVGSGPYRFEGWTSGEGLTAIANPRYFRGKPAIPRLALRFVGDDQSAFNLFHAGALDLFQGAPPSQLAALQAAAPGRVTLTPAPTWEHLLFNLARPITGELAVRQALARLLDRPALARAAYGGVFLPAWSEVPHGSWAYEPAVERANPFDPKAAVALLEAAGWRLGANGLRAKGGRALRLELVTTTDKPGRMLAAQLLRHQWRALGIELGIERLPASVLWGAGGRLASGGFDLALIASNSRPDPDTSFRWRSDQLPPTGQNRARYRSADADRLLALGQRTLPLSERKPVYGALARRLALDLPVAPLLYWVDIDATSQRLTGYRPNPTLRGNLWNVWEWKLGNGNEAGQGKDTRQGT